MSESMESVPDFGDCDWYLPNLLNSSFNNDESRNWTLCERYFAQSATTVVAENFITETETTPLEMTSTAKSIIPDLISQLSTIASTKLTTKAVTLETKSAIAQSTKLLQRLILPTEPSVNYTWNDYENSSESYNNSMDIIVEAYSKSHNMSLNSSLCEWYLPTMRQVPRALGNTGIALWVLGFVITFTLIVMFLKQFHFIYTTAHKSFRRHLYSICSIYVVMALMTSIGSGIPRAHAVCSAMKDVFMAIGIGHFVDLTIAMYGGENVMAWYLRERYINVRVVPFLKCFCCIPECKTKKLSVNILKWLVWQMKWSQAIYYLLKLIWKRSLENVLGIVPAGMSSSFIYLHIINVMSFVSGVFSLVIISSLVRDDLQEKYNYTIKAKTVRFTILTTKLQRLLFEILEAFDVFPCIPPLVSKKFYKNVLKDFIYLVEVLILGTITFFVYTKPGQYEEGNSKEIPQALVHKDDLEMSNSNDDNGFLNEEDKMVLRLHEGPESIC